MELNRRYLIAATLLHLALFALLFAGSLFPRKIVAPPVIQAALVISERPQQPAPEPERPNLEEQRKQEQQEKIEEQRREQERLQEQQRLQEKKRIAEEETQKRRQEEQRKKQDELRIKAEAERARVEEQKKKAAEEKQRQDEIKRKIKEAEEERQRQIDEERKRQLEEERKELERIKRQREAEDRRRRDEMMAIAAAEDAARAAAARGAAQAPWSAAIVDKIRRNWQRPPASADRFNCLVRVEQLPGGEVVRASIVRSCGSAVLDRSVENAVLKASPLPSPPDPSLFERILNVTFCPTPDAC